MKQKNCTPVGMAIASDAAEKNPSEMPGSPVVNMWCTHKPKLRNPVPTAASTIQLYPTIGVRANVGTIIATSATDGRNTM